MTALKAEFSPMAGPGIEISEKDWGKVAAEEHENVEALACGQEFGSFYLKKDGSVWPVFEEEPEHSSAMQISFDPFDSRLDVLTEGGTLETKLIEQLQTEEERSEAASWQDIVQVMSYDMIDYALHADGSLTRVRKKDYPYGDADANYPWPAEPVNVVRLFPGTGWYLTADGTLYHIDTKNEFPSKKKIALGDFCVEVDGGRYYSQGKMRQPSGTILNADSGYVKDHEEFGRCAWSFSTHNIVEDSGIMLWHENRANASFMDGHVESGREIFWSSPSNVRQFLTSSGDRVYPAQMPSRY